MKNRSLLYFFFSLLIFTSCNKDDDETPVPQVTSSLIAVHEWDWTGSLGFYTYQTAITASSEDVVNVYISPDAINDFIALPFVLDDDFVVSYTIVNNKIQLKLEYWDGTSSPISASAGTIFVKVVSIGNP